MAPPKYTRPLDSDVAQWVDTLDEAAREFFEERSAIREYVGLQLRRDAERAAMAETCERLRQRQSPD